MIAYNIKVLPLIRELKDSHPKVYQTWYAYNAGVGEISPRIISNMYEIMVRGLPKEYLLDPTKIILVISKEKIVPAERLSKGGGLIIVMGSRYLVGYIGGISPQAQCLREKVQDWAGRIQTLSGVTRKHLQAA